jgi:hypothetical protein
MDTTNPDLVADAIVKNFCDNKEKQSAVIEAKNFRASKCVKVIEATAFQKEHEELLSLLPEHNSAQFVTLPRCRHDQRNYSSVVS